MRGDGKMKSGLKNGVGKTKLGPRKRSKHRDEVIKQEKVITRLTELKL